MLNKLQFPEAHAKLATEGGFTIDPRTGKSATTGYSIAPRGNEMRVPISESGPAQLEQYASENAARFERGASLGGWRSDTEDVYDTPTVQQNTPGGQARGRKQMILSGQEAMYHIDTGTEHFNPFDSRVRAAQGREPHEIADIASRGRAGSEFAFKQPEVQAWVESPRNHARTPTSDSGRSPYSR